MRAAMAAAAVGDDVFGDDPTVIALQERVAEMLGKEAAVFVPSGTMSNLIGVRLHCRPGDALICEASCHLFYYEQGGYAQLCGVAARPLPGQHGVLTLEQVQSQLLPDNVHFTRTRLLCLENTHNRGGGRVQPYETIRALCGWARQNGLRTHLDGARLWNAVVASGIAAAQWARHFDTVNVCFSKGLGAPVGSALAGPAELIREAVRHRKVLGGGMRQAGILAAAALHALTNHVDRLADDHRNARRLADGIRQIDGLRLNCETIDTNIVIFYVEPRRGSAEDLVRRLREQGVLLLASAPSTIRAVTHLDVTAADIDRLLEILADTVAAARSGPQAPQAGE
jgi:threonine aldolase